MKTFKGRVVAAGELTAEALVSHGGLNTLASFQKALQFGDKTATCGDQNNPDLYGKKMLGKALCLPMTIGSTTGGLASARLHAFLRADRFACRRGSNPFRCMARGHAATRNRLPRRRISRLCERRHADKHQKGRHGYS